MQGKIFISYRREDARGDARSVYQRLELTFGPDQLFMDVDSIPTGSDFRRLLDQHVKQCEVMLVIIGSNWLDCTDESGRRRLDDQNDFVRLEIAMALKRRIAVVPVLVDNARLPRSKELPKDLRTLVDRQAAILRHETFARDVDVLVQDVRAILEHHRARKRQVLLGAAVVAAASASLAIVFWPQIGSLLGVERGGSKSSASLSKPGITNVNVAGWQKDVRPASFKVEESPNIGGLKPVVDRLKDLSNGRLQLSVVPAGSLVKPAERLDALNGGALDAVWETPANWSYKSRALVLYGGQVPRGLDNKRLAAWLHDRGAREVDAIYQDRLGLKVKSIPCRIFSAEGIWFKTHVSVPQDLRGALIRSPSFLMMRLAPKLGFKVVPLPATEIVGALERGELDGAEFGNPPSDYERGLHKAAKHYYFPGFHAPSLSAHLMFNLDRWNALEPAARGLIEEACRTQIDADLKSNGENVQRALARLRAEGVQVHAFSALILAAVDRAMREVVEELSASDADFKRGYASYNAFR
jgi:TRAP-type mannitol/chloroaromatic compound transport system substrate-binding protein